MKYFVCFITAIFALESCSAQQIRNDFSKRIQIPSSYLRLDTLASIISSQSHMRLSMDTRKFPPFRLVHLQKGSRSISGVLEDIQKVIGVEYKILDDHIIFIEKPSVSTQTTKHLSVPVGRSFRPSPEPQKTLRSRDNTLNTALPPTTLPPISTNLTGTRKIIAVSGNHSRINLPDHIDSIKVNPEMPRLWSFHPSSLRGASSDPKSDQDNTDKKENTLPIQLETGIFVNELLYLNPTLRIGVPLFYGVGSWGSNFKRSGFLWGVGTSLSIDDRWRLDLQAITGKFKSSRSYDSLNLRAGERLYKLEISAEKALNSRLKLQAGIGLNVMGTRYSSSGPTTITSSDERKDLINRLNLPGPPYTIIDHYSSSSKRNGKFWIGVQVGLLYDLIFFYRP